MCLPSTGQGPDLGSSTLRGIGKASIRPRLRQFMESSLCSGLNVALEFSGGHVTEQSLLHSIVPQMPFSANMLLMWWESHAYR